MALTEVHADLSASLSHESFSDDRSDGVHMINSLREIPLVDTSVDFDSAMSERMPNLPASLFSTPRYDSGPGSSARSRFDDLDTFDDSKFPFSDVDTDTDNDSGNGTGSDGEAGNHSTARGVPANAATSHGSPGSRHAPRPADHSGERDAGLGTASTTSRSFASARGSPEPQESQTQQQKHLDHITKGAAVLASMSEFIDVWAPTAHNVVVTAAALQRDAAAFATALTKLLDSRHNADPQVFATQFYQLREAYASLVSSSSIAAGSTGASSWARASTKPSKVDQAAARDQDLETTWDDRQLVDSFMTLLRTSPGFIASAFSQLTSNEAASFCAAEDSSALNTLFHGVLGSAEPHRPAFFAEMLVCTTVNRSVLNRALLSKFLDLGMGSLAPASVAKLERFLRRAIATSTRGDLSTAQNFLPVLRSCLPPEFVSYTAAVLDANTGNPAIEKLVNEYLAEYARRLITAPHQFGVLCDTYIGEKLAKDLDGVLQHVSHDLVRALDSARPVAHSEVLWAPDELVVVKGSDILQLYHALLPARGVLPGVVTSNGSDSDDEWCLENIRGDLVPVIRELTHSSGRADGWQVFKVGTDGLVTDLGNDMGLTGQEGDDEDGLDVACDALGKLEGPLLSRLTAAREDAELRGDHIAVLQLTELSESLSIEPFVKRVDLLVTTQKQRCRVLRRTLDQAASDQQRERERLIKLLSVLDVARVHVWYEAEVRPGTPYYRARETIKQLFPLPKPDSGEDGDKLGGDAALADLAYGPVSSTRSRRLSILSSHSAPESPLYNRDIFPKPKLTDREVDAVLIYIRRLRVRNLIPAEELFPRALVEIGQLSRKILDRDHLAGYVTFKRDRHYQTQYHQAQLQAQGSLRQPNKRLSQHRRSSLGLFDFFDSGSYAQHSMPVTLHSSTSTQFLGLASSHDSLRSAARPPDSQIAIGPPAGPTVAQVNALLLSDLGQVFMATGTETDSYMQQTGRMLLEGDGHRYQPLLDDISHALSPEAKLAATESLVRFTQAQLRRKQGVPPSRSDVIHELGRALGREPGTLYRDLETISFLVHPSVLEQSEEFGDVCDAAQNVLDSVVARSTDYAARFLRYYLETKTTAAPQMSSMGIADSVAIWAFCAKCGNSAAQRKLAELYMHFTKLVLEIRPLSRPSSVIDGIEPSMLREAIAQHWLGLASRI